MFAKGITAPLLLASLATATQPRIVEKRAPVAMETVTVTDMVIISSTVGADRYLYEMSKQAALEAEQYQTIALPEPVVTNVYEANTATVAYVPPPAVQPLAAEPLVTDDKTATTDPEGESHFLPEYKNVVYFTNWGIYGANFQPTDLDTSLVTHVLYAFLDVAPDGTIITMDSYADLDKVYDNLSSASGGNNVEGCVKEFYKLKKANRNLKVLLSVGGWNNSPSFAPAVSSAAGRQQFANSAMKLIADWGLDGLDIDWEYPANAEEAAAFVALLQVCRETMDTYSTKYANGYHFEMTIASPAGANYYSVMDLKAMDQYLDAWHLMAYDYAGSWDTVAGHQANVFSNPMYPDATRFNTDGVIDVYADMGISSSKIVMGMPLYGRAFSQTTGLGSTYNGIGPGSFQEGVWLYRDLPRPGAVEMYDYTAMASYSYDVATEEFVSYDNAESVAYKASYIHAKGLGGAVFWEASGDKAGEQSLVRIVKFGLGALQYKENLLTYPQSIYDNIASGLQEFVV